MVKAIKITDITNTKVRNSRGRNLRSALSGKDRFCRFVPPDVYDLRENPEKHIFFKASKKRPTFSIQVFLN